MNKHEQQIINKIKESVKTKLANDSTGHDWWHVERVYRLSMQILKTEGGNEFVVALGALLHDIAETLIT